MVAVQRAKVLWGKAADRKPHRSELRLQVLYRFVYVSVSVSVSVSVNYIMVGYL